MSSIAPYNRNGFYGDDIQSKVLRGGDPGSRPQRRLRPISRGQPGYVYSKKMTLGCSSSASGRKCGAKKKRGGAALGGKGGVPAVRSLLPWWQHSTSKIGADMNRGLRPACHGPGQGNTAGHDAVSSLAEHSSPQQPMGTITPEKPANDSENQLSGASGIDTVDTVQNMEDGQQRTSEYTHYANLFDNPPPSIPSVDQYVFNDNVMYEAITKRGHTRALPVSPTGAGVLGIEESGNAPWGTASRGEELQTGVDQSSLLYADEDIDKARNSPRYPAPTWPLVTVVAHCKPGYKRHLGIPSYTQ